MSLKYFSTVFAGWLAPWLRVINSLKLWSYRLNLSPCTAQKLDASFLRSLNVVYFVILNRYSTYSTFLFRLLPLWLEAIACIEGVSSLNLSMTLIEFTNGLVV